MSPKVSPVLAAILIAVVSFGAGVYAPALLRSGAPAGAMQNSPSPFTTFLGETRSFSSGALTVLLEDGSSQTVLVASTTSVTSAPRQITAADIAKGSLVSVVGLKQADGTISAQAVQVIPPAPAPAK